MKTFKQFNKESLSEASKPIASFDGDYGARADVHTDAIHGHKIRLYKDGKELNDQNLYFRRKKEAIEHAKREVGLDESVSDLEAAKFELTHHVTNTMPSTENIIKMHDWIHHIHKLGGSVDHEYEKIANNPLVPQPYRIAASA